MKSKKIIIILACFLCCVMAGCTGQKDKIVYGEMNMEDQPYWNTPLSPVAKGENGYYYLKQNAGSRLICYMDAATCNSTVLCSNAECKHDGGDCPAYLSGLEYLNDCLYYYKNKLYVVFSNNADGFCYLEEAAANGSYKNRLFEIGENKTEHGNSLVFHDDSVYIYSTTAGLGFEESTTSIRRRSLDGKEDEIIYSHTGKGPVFCALKSYGDKLYFLVQDQEMEMVGTSAKVTIRRKGLYAYDYADKKVRKVLDEDGVCDYAINVKDRTLYYYVYGDGLYKKELEGEGVKKIYGCEEGQSEMCNVSCDGNYVYLDNGRYLSEVSMKGPKKYAIYVMDFEGNMLNTIPSWHASVQFGDEDYLFANAGDENGHPMCYIKKGEITTAKEWTHIDPAGKP